MTLKMNPNGKNSYQVSGVRCYLQFFVVFADFLQALCVVFEDPFCMD